MAHSSAFDEPRDPREGIPHPFRYDFHIPSPSGAVLLERIVHTIRAREWWHYKTPAALAGSMTAAFVAGATPEQSATAMLWLVLTGLVGGVFASVFNDLMDFRSDWEAGKVTGVMTFHKPGRLWWLAGIVAATVGLIGLLGPLPRGQAWFAVLALVHVAYTMPPIRLKDRGIWGVLCIAAGEHLLASMIGLGLVTDITGKSLPLPWCVALVLWSLAFGVRSILWHQIKDSGNDREANAGTFGARFDAPVLRSIGERWVFPVELAAAVVCAVWMRTPWVAWMALAHVAVEWLRWKYLEANWTIVAPASNQRFALLDWAIVFWPLAALLAMIERDGRSWALLVGYGVLFPGPLWLLCCHMGHWLRWRVWPPIFRFLCVRADAGSEPPPSERI